MIGVSGLPLAAAQIERQGIRRESGPRAVAGLRTVAASVF